MEVGLKIGVEFRAAREAGECEPIVVESGRSGGPWPELTRTQALVARMLCDGMSRSEIAVALSVSPKTVDTHRGQVMRRMGARNEVDLVRMAVAWGVIRIDATGGAGSVR